MYLLYHFQGASHPARNGRYNPYSKVVCSLMTKSQVDIQVPYSEEEEYSIRGEPLR